MNNDQRQAAGGNAFPDQYYPGLTIRDYFAAAALTGYLAAYAGDGIALPDEKNAAQAAYEYADAMLTARAKPTTIPPTA